jgi:RNA polymerase sigma-70 factor (ECF subfamily)
VLVAARDGEPEAQNALASLFSAYWYPLFAYLRARGRSQQEAEDLLQAFFVHLFEQQTLSRADRLKGPFRGFLIGCLKFFLADERDRAIAQKRGGGARIVSIDAEAAESRLLEDTNADPVGDVERDFDRRWARLIMERALGELESQYAARPDVYRALKGESRYQDVAASIGVSDAMVKTTVHRMRKQFREALRREVAMTVSEPHEVDAELRYLVQVLAAD